jgi:glycosyltransferase involved in cell wall biosynthesis
MVSQKFDKEIHVIHVAEDMRRSGGGVASMVNSLSANMQRDNMSNEIISSYGSPRDLDEAIKISISSPNSLGKFWGFGVDLRRNLKEAYKERAGMNFVSHIHGVWMAPQYFGVIEAYKKEIPLVLTAHGMLRPWFWQDAGWVKKLKKMAYSNVLESMIQKVSILHAVTNLERDELHRLYPKKKIIVIPNMAPEITGKNFIGAELKKNILFLGRIHPVKGIDKLIHAFTNAKISSSWSLKIAGSVWDSAYNNKLKKMVDDSGMRDRIRFVGPVYGDEKINIMKSSWVMVMPSSSEVIGLVNLEAACNGLPSITTIQTGLNDWEEGGGVLIDPLLSSIQRSIEDACSWSEAERRSRGVASYELVEKKYSWAAVKPMWENLYSGLRTQGA